MTDAILVVALHKSRLYGDPVYKISAHTLEHTHTLETAVKHKRGPVCISGLNAT